MGLYSDWKTDENKETEGVWVTLGPEIEFKIARAGGGNSRYKNLAAKLLRPFQREIEHGVFRGATAEKKALKAMVEIYAKSVVTDWRGAGIQGPSGEALEFSVDNVAKVLRDLPDLFDRVQKIANDASLFRDGADLEAEAKN